MRRRSYGEDLDRNKGPVAAGCSLLARIFHVRDGEIL
jgi:hypothetical protein